MTLNYQKDTLQIVSHRGLPNAFPENTMAGYRKVMELNVDMLEIDVHLTKDQQLVVIHDETIDRTSNGKGRIANYTLPELKTFDFGSYKDIKFKGEQIPTLDEVIELCLKFQKKLLIEIKKPNLYPGIERKLLAILKNWGIDSSQVIIQSFDISCIERLYELSCEYELGLLCSKRKYWYKKPNYSKISQIASYVNPNYALVTRKFVEEAHRYHLKVMPYTVNKSSIAKKLLKYGVDGLITDEPEKILK
ncbi:glycerophosphoryl diester phosphodiesterase [Staphylococcus argenteus]|uniref:glycerophosphodiester phosphodiesterase n=1 Tax=Staphylococcus argenteus TaxID=985002 RepID=UPI001FC8C2BE|nr:glycerophosphodiester phosphodiesterase family protein [Staphylococcus argenteus]GJG19617.1 glycerophosphoryl diester phosphodiesterase [Staphylococcus argenteus]